MEWRSPSFPIKKLGFDGRLGNDGSATIKTS